MRMAQPAVQVVSHTESFAYLKDSHNVFFGYIGKQQGPLWVHIKFIILYTIFVQLSKLYSDKCLGNVYDQC